MDRALSVTLNGLDREKMRALARIFLCTTIYVSCETSATSTAIDQIVDKLRVIPSAWEKLK